jgi:hypothetical protein
LILLPIVDPMRLFVAAAFVLFSLWHGWDAFAHREMKQAAGVVAPDEPRQTMPAVDGSPIRVGEYVIEPLADYEITARILSRERYRFDRTAGLSPLDFALGWGRMSDSGVIGGLSITQGRRHFSWVASELPLPLGELISHTANVHLIPADDGVRDDLFRMRKGQVVTLVGRLVRVTAPDGFLWTSSLTRTDSGSGACEVIWVEKAFPQRVSR